MLEYEHEGLTEGVIYYYALLSLDENGKESDASSRIVWVDTGTGETGYLDPIFWADKAEIEHPEVLPEQESEEDDDSSGCLIATATYGTDMMYEVLILKDFWNRFLTASS